MPNTRLSPTHTEGDFRVAVELLREARHFLNAQAYTQEEIDEFCHRLDLYLGIPSDR